MNTFWVLLGNGPFFGKWQVVVDIFWLVVGGGGYILAGGGWWWIYFGWWWEVVDDGGSWWVVAQFSLTPRNCNTRQVVFLRFKFPLEISL